MENFIYSVAKWPEEKQPLLAIREQVFVAEQSVPKEIEWDDKDNEATHFHALTANNKVVATARLLNSGQLGRMAVLKEQRSQGVGRGLLAFVIQWCQLPPQSKRFSNIHCHAQTKAIKFYQNAGFSTIGSTFIEAGIEHQSMELKL